MGLFDFGFNFSKGGGTDIGSSKELMKYQSDQWRGNTQWFNENGYKFLRQGLINADYNPILAIGASPLSGEMPNATAQQGTESFGFNATPSANKQANTAEKIANSTISLNNANAQKASEEALTQGNYRANLDSQTALNNIETIWKNESMPLQLKMLETQVELNKYMSANYSANTAKTQEETRYVKDYAEATKKNAEIAEKQYNLNKDTTISEQKYREDHPLYNWADRWSKAISPWAMPVAIGSSAHSQPNYEKTYTEHANFDRNGTYKGHTRTTTTRTKGRR